MNGPVQSLWIGARLSTMERLSLASFLAQGHEVHLYTYGPVDGVPPGVIVRDGNEILPSSRIFQYREHASYSGFSNFFRYKLLAERGGWWVDADVICLRPFAFDGEHVFASERAKGQTFVSSAVIGAPAGSAAMQYAWSVCDAANIDTLKWGETGPRLVADAVSRFGLERFVQPPEVFCPIGYPEWRRLIDPDPPALDAGAHAVHLWNEMWRREGADKDGPHPPTSFYEAQRRNLTRVLA